LAAIALPRDIFIFHWLFLFMLGMAVFLHHAGHIGAVGFSATLLLAAGGACYTLGPLVGGVGAAAAASLALLRINNPILTYLGKISYSLYLIHVPVGMKLINLGSRLHTGTLGKFAILAAALAITIGAAHLLCLLVEEPARKWSAAIKYRACGHGGHAEPTPIPSPMS